MSWKLGPQTLPKSPSGSWITTRWAPYSTTYKVWDKLMTMYLPFERAIKIEGRTPKEGKEEGKKKEYRVVVNLKRWRALASQLELALSPNVRPGPEELDADTGWERLAGKGHIWIASDWMTGREATRLIEIFRKKYPFYVRSFSTQLQHGSGRESLRERVIVDMTE